MKRQLLFASLIIALGLSYGIPSAQAHVLKEDNGVYAVMHIDPDDNPVAGETTPILFDFGSAQGSFSLSDCTCRVSLVKDNQTLTQYNITPILKGTGNRGTSSVVFPQLGVYQIVAQGKSVSHKFGDFKLVYLVRVAVGTAGAAPDSSIGLQILLLSISSLIILGLIGHWQIGMGDRNSRK